MNIQEVIQIVKHLVDAPLKPIIISRSQLEMENGLTLFNNTIRSEVKNRPGIYVWENNDSGEIIYVGMAGKVKTNGEFVEHDIQKRLLASRGKDPGTKKDIQTNAYVRNIMQIMNMSEMNIYPMYSLEGQLPGYLEALVMYYYYRKNWRLPFLNASF